MKIKFWRPLEDGEVICRGDMFQSSRDGSWHLTSAIDRKVGWDVNTCGPILKYRRKCFSLKKKVSGWNVTFATRKQARLAAAMSFKEAVLKGAHKA